MTSRYAQRFRTCASQVAAGCLAFALLAAVSATVIAGDAARRATADRYKPRAAAFAGRAVESNDVSIRLGSRFRITAVHRPVAGGSEGRVAGTEPEYPHPRPRLAGFSPLVAIATTDEFNRTGEDPASEHRLEPSYVGNPLHPAESLPYVIGFLDSGADVDLAAGAFAFDLGLFDLLTGNTLEIGGVGGSADAFVTFPVGVFVDSLEAINAFGELDTSNMLGHSNVSMLVAPQIECSTEEVLTAIVGTPLLTFYTSVIEVSRPIAREYFGSVLTSPTVNVQQKFEPIPQLSHAVAIEFGGLSLATTAAYWPDPFDPDVPFVPTLMTLLPGSIPFGGAFFGSMQVAEGEVGPLNPLLTLRVIVDTGAQITVISPGVAANLNLPFTPDFTVEVCGVGGSVSGVPGYYLDFVRINALGGPLQYSRVPVVVLDLPSPEGGSLDGILGMNLFWNRDIVWDPDLLLSGSLFVSSPIDVPFGDNDVNFAVGKPDAAYFIECMTPPDGAGTPPQCDHLDLAFDGDVDLRDLQQFMLCYSGMGFADPTCGAN